ncbi:MAG: D-alanyl-D-alanine carboxypeptidase/D-alanyl-D-alanine-endopeptidase [Bacteroidetes bacterium]|nr:D-alanyl-D-alanine carboxypeptidase/D-alanyl-D-alanine-endopeptidase [Bacteroidota bacterium]
MKLIPVVILFAVIVSGCASSVVVKEANVRHSPAELLRKELASRFHDPEFFNAFWGVKIQSLKTGQIIYQQNANKSFMPASNLKLYTTSAALTMLTPEFRYVTKLETNGSTAGGILTGDVYLKGSGDPTICGRYNGGNVILTFQQWADSLKAAGIREIKGNIVGDNSAFDGSAYGAGWAADYETDWYAAQMGGIVFNDNCVDMTVTAGDSVGAPARISWNPNTKYISVVNETVTTPPDSNPPGYYISFHRAWSSNVVHVSGDFPINKPAWHESISVDNPARYAATVLKEVLEREGITVDGEAEDIHEARIKPDYESATTLATYTSPELSVIVETINKRSQNLYAEQLFRTMGMVFFGHGNMRTGRYVAYPLYSRWGIDTTRIQMHDGCGLSPDDMVSPTTTVSVLTAMYHGKYFKPFYESLPIAGVDGSLRYRMKGTAAENNVHAKTGTIEHVSSLSGYVTDKDGEVFVFSMMVNHFTVPTSLAEKAEDGVCERLASFSMNEGMESQNNRSGK